MNSNLFVTLVSGVPGTYDMYCGRGGLIGREVKGTHTAKNKPSGHLGKGPTKGSVQGATDGLTNCS